MVLMNADQPNYFNLQLYMIKLHRSLSALSEMLIEFLFLCSQRIFLEKPNSNEIYAFFIIYIYIYIRIFNFISLFLMLV